MDLREERGREMAERLQIVKRDGAWVVPSQSNKGTYRVSLESNAIHCTCLDFELRGQPCKHVFAAAFFVQRQTVTETTPSGETRTTVTETRAVRITYQQDWPKYNAAQSQEGTLFRRLLHDLCASVPEPVQERGRPRIPVADALFTACYKTYTGMSARRFMTDVREAHAAGLIQRPWSFNRVLRTIEDESLTPILLELVRQSAAPLAAVEENFAVDSTGFGTVRYYRHFTAKWGGREIDQRDWVKLHAVIGCKTNVIAAATVTDRDASDAPEFAPLVNYAAQTFSVKNVMADKAYATRLNVRTVDALGATPYIALKKNNVGHATQMTKRQPEDVKAWNTLWHLYNLHRDEFLAKYHQRSNAESTFSSLKRVFGDTLRSKNRPAQINELLLTVIAYNIVCLIHSIFELGVTIPGLHLNEVGCTQSAG